MYTVINVIGPKARELIGELTDVSLKIADFPQMSGKVGCVCCEGMFEI